MTQKLVTSAPAQVRAVSGRPATAATLMEVWQGLSSAVVDTIADDWYATEQKYSAGRQEHYFSAEFLMGRALLNNLSNLGMVDEARETVGSFGVSLSDVLEQEPDAALGNGGLGRLAACFLDSCATLDLPVNGFGILYRYGLFKQVFEDGFQTEHPDPWMEEGYPFVIRHEEAQRLVRYRDMTVRAIPYDMPITGYGTKNVGNLRLWKAEPLEEFDYDAFNSQRFTEAIVERERTSDISRVLYPNDTTYEGKVLRVRQQYFFVAASLQSMIETYVRVHGDDLRDFGVSRKAEKGIRHQPFGRDIDDFIGAAPCVIQREHILSGREGAVEIGRAHAVLQQREDLIAHQRNERRNDEGDARQNERGNLIADRFARARGHDGHHVAPAQNRGNRVFLPRTEIVIAENLFKRCARRFHRCHLCSFWGLRQGAALKPGRNLRFLHLPLLKFDLLSGCRQHPADQLILYYIATF